MVNGDSPWSPSIVIVRVVGLQLPQLGKLQEDVVRIHERDDEAGRAVAPPAFEDVISQQRERRMEQDSGERRSLPPLVHLTRGERCIAVHPDEMFGQVSIWMMLQLILQISDGSVYPYG